MKYLTLSYIFLFSIAAHAQEAAPQLPAAVQKANQIVNGLSQGWVMTVAVVIVELAMRTFKTKEPKSLLYMLANVFKMIASVFSFLAELMDKALQRLKDEGN